MKNLSVLIVDDDRFIINITTRMLENLSVGKILSAQDGGGGLVVVDEQSPNVILVDLNMPSMDGLEFLRHLASRDTDCSIVLFSGEDKRVLQTAVQLAEAHQLNILGYIQKPVKPGPLKQLLEDYYAQQAGTKRGPIEPLTVDQIVAGLKTDCVEVFFQPKVTVTDRRLAGVEALARWKDPERGLVPPIAFIPVVEANGLIDELTEQVFTKSMSAAADWLSHGLQLKVAVNFSVETLCHFHIVEFVVESSKKLGIDLADVVFEVTESRIMEDVAAPLEILTRLRMKGVGLSIDDFGTGASSMQQLKRIPFTELKIDRAFVAGAPTDEEARAMLESSVELARRLGLGIVAEGVETQEEWDIVEKLGVDVVQGYFIAKPMPADDLLAWARDRGDI